MNPVCRLCTGLLLALSLALTGFGTGFARAQAPAVGEIVLCRGLTTVTLPVDAEGQPTAAPHLCPDAVMALFAELAAAKVPAAPLPVWTRGPVRPAGTALTGRERAVARARGPPLSR